MKVLIYADEGVSLAGLRQARLTFGKVEHVTAKDLICRDWENGAAALIIPGGADIPYMKRLKGKGNQRIRAYVENGGVYIGICAGAYYAGRKVEFALNSSQEVNQERELQFFPGIVRGPILAPYDPDSLSGAKIAKIYRREAKPLHFFYNGGGYFVDASRQENVSVLGTYDERGKYPAIIECKVGKGKALLSGVHFEYRTGENHNELLRNGGFDRLVKDPIDLFSVENK